MVTPHINKWDYWNYKIRETGTGTEYYFNTNNKAGVTPYISAYTVSNIRVTIKGSTETKAVSNIDGALLQLSHLQPIFIMLFFIIQ